MTRIQAEWLSSEATQSIFAMLDGFECYAVGGCVRDTLLGAPVKDIDIATSALPTEVIALAEKAGHRSIPTGIEHGTVTVVVKETPFEITTFRRDVETDGRRAVVAFSDRMEEDALRRDFTMNAIYAGAEGDIHDPVSGLPDIEARRIRFIEDADRRIREDYLRSLRYFRFHAWYGDPNAGLDVDALDAISRNISGLETLSKERITAELVRLLEAPNPAPSIAAMRVTGVLNTILPGANDKFLGPLVSIEESLQLVPDFVRRLAVLGGKHEALMLTNLQSKRLTAIMESMGKPAHELGFRLGKIAALNVKTVEAACLQQLLTDEDLADIEKGAAAVFPIKAEDLMPTLTGKALGDALKKLQAEWIESGFTLSRDALLRRG